MQLGKGKEIFQFACFIALLIIFPSFSWAYGGDTPVSQGLNYVIDAIYGATGLSVATVAIIGWDCCALAII